MNMKMPPLLPALRCCLALLVLAFSLIAIRSGATTYNPPQLMSYQGYVTDANGNPLGSTNTGPKNYNIVFRIWDLQTGGTTNGTDELYAEQQTVTVNNGYFSVLLGQGTAYATEPHTNALSGLFTPATPPNRYVEITVLGIGPGGCEHHHLPTAAIALLALFLSGRQCGQCPQCRHPGQLEQCAHGLHRRQRRGRHRHHQSDCGTDRRRFRLHQWLRSPLMALRPSTAPGAL